MRIIITRGVIVGGAPRTAGDVVDVDDALGCLLCASGRAAPYTAEQEETATASERETPRGRRKKRR